MPIPFEDLLLIGGIVCTVLHVAMDVRQLSVHARHPRDWFVLVSVIALLGHVILTGEYKEWAEQLGII